MLLHGLVYIENAKRRRVKASQQHTLHNHDVEIFAADDIVFYILLVVVVFSSESGLHFVLEEVADDCLVFGRNAPFIAFGGDGSIADQSCGPNASDPVNGMLQLHGISTGRDCYHRLEAARLTVVQIVLVNVEGDHGQALLCLRQMDK